MPRRPKLSALLGVGAALGGLATPEPAHTARPWSVSFSTGQDTFDFNSPMNQDLVAHILSAGATLEVAIYSLTDRGLNSVTDALIDRHNAGVTVRVQTDDDNLGNAAVTDLIAAGIPVRGDLGDGDEMHDKFVIVDGVSVWTGTANFTDPAFSSQDNMAIVMEDTAIAAAYLDEFEEMWAGVFKQASPSPSPQSEFTLDGNPLRVLFGAEDDPTNDTSKGLRWFVQNAASSVHFASYVFTGTVGDAFTGLEDDVVAAHAAGRVVRGVMHRFFANGEPYLDPGGSGDQMDELGLDVVRNPAGWDLMHNKLAVIDLDTLVIGSANFTFSANAYNDENLVFFTDAAAARRGVLYINWVYSMAADEGTPASPPPDTTPPPPVCGVMFTDPPGRNAVDVSWAASGAADVVRYHIFVADEDITNGKIGFRDRLDPARTVDASSTGPERIVFMGDGDPVPMAVDIWAAVTAMDASGNESPLAGCSVDGPFQVLDDGRGFIPSFEGIETLTQTGPDTAQACWDPALDDTTVPADMVYRVFVANSSGGQDFGSPDVTTPPGTQCTTLSGLSTGVLYCVVVRAVDEEGNTEDNTVERCVVLQAGACVPTGPETCDGVDNDCDGNTDGMSEACYGGPPGTEGVGICASGSRTCSDGVWSGCAGEVLPGDERCDAQDNDCDGTTDGVVESCYSGPPGTAGVGECVEGARTCTDGAWGLCAGEVPPGFEVCDGLDNDCDGTTDGMTQACYSGAAGTEGVGECVGGTETCTAGVWGACVGETPPGQEACDGLDNDCDGSTDGVVQGCYSGPPGTEGVGICAAGTETCTDGSWGACVGDITPGTEVCDGLDNDCDGTTDGVVQACYGGPAGTEGVGVCVGGMETCTAGSWGGCLGEVTPSAEVCDGLDNDCDGATDGLVQACYGGPAGTAGVGECAGGTETCAGGTWGTCIGAVTPQTEQCDGLDNDCDGATDGLMRACYTGPVGTEGVGLCEGGMETCTLGRWDSGCAGETTPGAEVCDGADNDCDGVTDGMGRPCYTGPAGTEGVGACAEGTETCTAGGWGACAGETAPRAETCDDVDNDCDGVVDGYSEGCYGGPAGTEGVGLCVGGTRDCSAGAWSACVGEVQPVPETCNGNDDDCDGAADPGCACVNGERRPCYSGPAGTSGVGECEEGEQRCGGGVWGACNGDTTPEPEDCNRRDDDCDGVVDEYEEPCYSGPGGTEGVGVCVGGARWCSDGDWGDCEGEVVPGSETCNGDDDDCDGVADPGCACVDGATRACYSGFGGTEGVGACRGGTEVCAGGAWGPCVGEIVPVAESCNRIDDDCDGATDGQDRGCYGGAPGTEGVGVCVGGAQTCTDGAWGACAGEVVPQAETCNGVDDDCDGGVDPGCACVDGETEACYGGASGTEGVGACVGGTRTCSGGVWGPCEGEVTPAAEVCDGVDNDCDGVADGFDESCYSGAAGTEGVGVCAGGTRSCAGGAWLACVGEVTPASETCNGVDDDCDGTADPGCGCLDGETRSCYGGAAGTEGVGPCGAGVETCTGGQWGACEGSVEPAVEVCDGEDNDCDGAVDGYVEACYSGPPGTEGVGECLGGTATCTGGVWSACVGEVVPMAEVCNGVDDDCDAGTVDGADEVTLGAACDGDDDDDLCADGAIACAAGVLGCVDGGEPLVERCDGVDNDCDASTADGADEAAVGQPCDGDDAGLCEEGIVLCAGGALVCDDLTGDDVELCNGEDDDCDPTTGDGADDPAAGAACDGPDEDLCDEGQQRCLGGRIVCDDETGDSVEVEDGVDNDCDGLIDEGFGVDVVADVEADAGPDAQPDGGADVGDAGGQVGDEGADGGDAGGQVGDEEADAGDAGGQVGDVEADAGDADAGEDGSDGGDVSGGGDAFGADISDADGDLAGDGVSGDGDAGGANGGDGQDADGADTHQTDTERTDSDASAEADVESTAALQGGGCDCRVTGGSRSGNSIPLAGALLALLALRLRSTRRRGTP